MKRELVSRRSSNSFFQNRMLNTPQNPPAYLSLKTVTAYASVTTATSPITTRCMNRELELGVHSEEPR
jgi:hypothetical protein